MTVPTPRRFFGQCRLLGAHDWVSRSAEDGSRFVARRRCGKEKGDTGTNLIMGA